MEEFLKDYLINNKKIKPEYYHFEYSENLNEGVITGDCFEKGTSFIHKVAVLAAIDSNKCDFAHIVIGSQRHPKFNPEIKGYFYFNRGENDDMGPTMKRAFNLIQYMHPAFDY